MTDLKLNPTELGPDEKSGKPAKPCTNVQPTLRKIDSAPSTTTQDPDKKHRQIPVDLVEEESMESFPASDPPSHHHSSTSRRETALAGTT